MNDKPPLRIMMVDDHAVVREGLAAVLGKQSDMQIVASVDSGEEALAVLAEARPDIALLDVRMPDMDGIELLKRIKAQAPRLRVVMLSGQAGDAVIHKAITEGAVGYLLKTMRSNDLIQGVRDAMSGRLRPSPEVAQQLAERSFYTDLSEREIEVLRRAAEGDSNKQIGATLGITENTVKNHVKSIMVKLNASDRTEAVTIALRRGVIDFED